MKNIGYTDDQIARALYLEAPAGAAYSIGLAAFLMLATTHAWMVWGYSSLFWGDAGRWLHEIDRFAGGEVLYRDFVWPFPPLAMWLFGGVARAAGSEVNVVWLSTAVVYLGLCAAYYGYVVRLVRPGLRLPALLGGFLLAVGYVNVGGSPLPLGTYSPAGPLGALCLFLAIHSALSLARSPGIGTAALVGLFSALCVLSKQDFWIPAGYVLALAVGWLLARRNRAAAAAAAAACALTVGVAAAVIVAQAGAEVLPGVIGGFGHVEEFGGLGFPSWEGLTVEVIVMGWIFALVAAAAALVSPIGQRRPAASVAALCATIGIVGMAVYAAMTLRIGAILAAEGLPDIQSPVEQALWGPVQTGAALWKPTAVLLWSAIQAHLLPILLPLVLIAAIALRWRTLTATPLRAWALIFLGLCVAARMRRLFQGVDWFHFLLEIPVYLLVLELFVGPGTRQARRLATIVLLATLGAGVHAYWGLGRGPLTRRGTFPAVATPRGSIRIPPQEAADFHWLLDVLDGADPQRRRPIFAFGYTGGFSYFLDRENPSRASHGFRLSRWPADSLVASVSAHRPAPFLLDTRAYDGIGTPAVRIDLTGWGQPLVENHFTRFDRPYFERLLRGCREISRRPDSSAPFFQLFDCGGR